MLLLVFSSCISGSPELQNIQVTMFFKKDSLVAICIYNDIP